MRVRKLFYGLLVLSLLFATSLGLSGCGYVIDRFTKKPGGEITEYGKGYRFDRNGWVYVHIEGEPHERGVQHGYLVASELEEILRSVKYLTYWNTGKKWEFFVDAAVRQFAHRIDSEYLDEIKGIAAGAQTAGVDITWQEVLAWCGYEELLGYWWPNELAGKYAKSDEDHCSGFIATGSATKDGRIVMAHNSWDGFVFGQFFNVILDIEPAQGHRMFMQSGSGYIDSMTDFFVTLSSGRPGYPSRRRGRWTAR